MQGKINVPFFAYKGDEPYIFISYAHKDSDKVFPVIKKFNEAGFNIWYDEGIDPGNEWPLEIERSLKNSGVFLVFITPNSVKSRNVRNEINYALANNLPFLAIYLEETELIEGLGLQMGATQAIMKYRMEDNAFYYKSETVFTQMLSGEKAVQTFPAEVEKTETKRRAGIKKLALLGGCGIVLIIGIIIFATMIHGGGTVTYEEESFGITVSYPDKGWEATANYTGVTLYNYETEMTIYIYDLTENTVNYMADGNDMITAVERAMDEVAASTAYYGDIFSYVCDIQINALMLLDGYGGFLFNPDGGESYEDATDVDFTVRQYGNRILVHLLVKPPHYKNYDKMVKTYNEILDTLVIENSSKTIEERVAGMSPKG